jgi:serine/threonine protein kinase
MTTGMPPFFCSNRKELFERIKFSNPKYPPYLSVELRDLLDGLFVKNPSSTLSINILYII